MDERESGELRREITSVRESVAKSVGEIHEKVNALERRLTDSIHAVDKSVVAVTTTIAGFQQKMEGMPSKTQVRWIMTLVAGLILAVVSAAAAVIASIPNAAP